MMPFKPKIFTPLKSGALIRVISPSGPADEAGLQDGLEVIRNWGYRAELAPHARDRGGYLAGRDEDRLQDLIEALTDPSVEGVICSRGGYGVMRLLPGVPWERLAEMPPRALVGFSDVGAFQLTLLQRCGWMSLSGPQAANALSGGVDEQSLSSLRGWLDGSNRNLDWANGEPIVLELVQGGDCRGRLIPICFSILVSLLGTPYQPDLDGCVLCLEDVNEAPYRIDRMLWQLQASGALDGVKGMVLGQFVEAGNDYLDAVTEIALPICKADRISLWRGISYGHVPHLLTLPVGAMVRIEDTGRLTLEEKGMGHA